MVAKVIATGSNRAQALARLDQALDEMTILGVNTNLEYLQHLIRDPDVATGDMDTTLVDTALPEWYLILPHPNMPRWQLAWCITAPRAPRWRGTTTDSRLTGVVAPTYTVHTVEEEPEAFEVALCTEAQLLPTDVDHEFVYHDESGTQTVTLISEAPKPEGTRIWVASNNFTGVMSVLDHRAQVLHNLASLEAEERGVDPQVRAPLPGTVTAVHVPDGSHVTAGANGRNY